MVMSVRATTDHDGRLHQDSQDFDAAEVGEESKAAADLLIEIQTSLELVRES